MPPKKANLRRKAIRARNRKIKNVLLLSGLVLVIFALFAGSGFAYAANKETQDGFCASCHTQPESTYYQRSLTQPVDLASFHKTKDTRCIDCHSGVGLFGRMSAELLGARNATAYYTHTAVQPAKQTVPINDGNCLKCHQQVEAETATQDNHFHVFLPRWQAADSNAGKCISCHSGHATDVVANEAFINENQVRNVCEACHAVLRGD